MHGPHQDPIKNNDFQITWIYINRIIWIQDYLRCPADYKWDFNPVGSGS